MNLKTGCARSGVITHSRFAAVLVTHKCGGSSYVLSAAAYGASQAVECVRFNSRWRLGRRRLVLDLCSTYIYRSAAVCAPTGLSLTISATDRRRSSVGHLRHFLLPRFSSQTHIAVLGPPEDDPRTAGDEYAKNAKNLSIVHTPRAGQIPAKHSSAGTARSALAQVFRLHQSGEKWTVVKQGLFSYTKLSEQRRI
ncbi:hypothetical protein VTO73DRAFT_15144 [Trametes versicolor]